MMMTSDTYREVFWDLTPSARTLRKGMLRVRLLHDEDEYFQNDDAGRPEFDFLPPQPFMDTALFDPSGQTWQRRPIPGDSATRLGSGMWTSLPKELQAGLNADAADSRPILFKIGSTTSGVDDIPWEWLSPAFNQPWALQANARLVRSVPVRYAAPALTAALPLRVLVVITNPKDERLLYAPEEYGLITQGLQGRPEFRVEHLFEPRVEALAEALRREPHVMHYVGHAGISQGSGNIILHDESSGTAWISAAGLREMLPASVRLLCLSTCVTAPNYQIGGLPKMAAAPAEIPLPTAISNQYAIQPQSAGIFWAAFYPSLITHGGNVIEAFHDARLAVAAGPGTGTCDWASFCLTVRGRAGQPFRIGMGSETKERFAVEIQAQFAARLANNLADRLRQFGARAPDQLKRNLEEEGSRLMNLGKGLP
jgi:hypothetical protein